jgi:hypothetical protein
VQSLGNAPGLNNSSASAHASSNVSEASASVMAEDALPESGRKAHRNQLAAASMATVQPFAEKHGPFRSAEVRRSGL